ncbi:extracellular solute-binding protein [Patescibacteria group bacterium]|nr:extracellular solute-binding protein [Patescibacteria group bacterium]
MMFKKILSVCLLFVLTFSLSACRTKDVGPQATRYDDIELTYYKVFDGTDVMDPYINQFIATHPGLKINYRMFSDFKEYENTILDEMAEGEGPDIFSMQNTWFASNLGKITPMPEDQGTPDIFAQLFVDVAYEDLVRVDADGAQQIYGLPMTVDTLALYYNKAHFEDRYPTQGRPSETWDGIMDDVLKLRKMSDSESGSKFDVAGIAMGRADNIQRGVDILYLLMLQYGLDFYNENMSKAIFAARQGSKNFPGLQALKLFASFADPKEDYFAWDQYVVMPDSEEKEVSAFAEGKVSMIIGFSYLYDDIVNQMKVLDGQGKRTIGKSDIRIAPIPQLEDPKTSQDKRVTYANYFVETVSRNCEYPDLAWEFLTFLTSKEILEDYFDKTKKITSRRDMIEDQLAHPIYGVFASQIGYAESFPVTSYYYYKDLFAGVIGEADDGGAYQSGLGEAQNLITELLPPEGYINEVKVADDGEEE